MTVRDMTKSAICAAVLAICSQIMIPTPWVPITLQVLATTFIAFALTRKQAVWSVVIYIILGIIGLPVFAGASGGLASLMKPSSGFIFGFILQVYVMNTFKNHRIFKLPILSWALGYLSLYAIGLPFLYLIMKHVNQITLPITEFFTVYWIDFIPTDTLSFCVAWFAASKISKIIRN